jgi:hypothetical protein
MAYWFFGLGFGFGTSNTNPKYNPFLVFSHNWIFKIQILQDPSCSPSNPLAVQDPFCVLHLHCPCPLTPNIVCVVLCVLSSSIATATDINSQQMYVIIRGSIVLSCLVTRHTSCLVPQLEISNPYLTRHVLFPV